MSEEEKIQKYKKNKHKSKPKKKNKKVKWTELEDKILLEKGKEFNGKNWRKIASFIPGHSAIQCSSRFKRIQPGLIKGYWSKEEDKKLLELFKKYGKKWSNISKEMPWRTGKQIRDRYLNILDDRLNKNKFTKEEDDKIIELYEKFGNSWSKIAKYLIGRTGDMVKNRFYSTLGKSILNKENINCNYYDKNQFLGKKLCNKENNSQNDFGCKFKDNFENLNKQFISSFYFPFVENININNNNELFINDYLSSYKEYYYPLINFQNNFIFNYLPFQNVNSNFLMNYN